MNPIILIPARRAATRLPDKPLAMLGDAPMIVQVWRRAMAAALGPVLVATDDDDIAQAVREAGGRAVMTAASHASGSDRIFEALEQADPEGEHEIVINLQGDLPTLDAQLLHTLLVPLDNPAVDIATLAAPVTDPAERTAPSVVKPVIAFETPHRGRALYFSRAGVPYGDGPLYHHIGVYGWRREALARFVALPQSALEQREKLEQLRALEAGMRIDIHIVDTVPLGVDTPEDLKRARALLAVDM